MSEDEMAYQSYLLRMWQESQRGDRRWRASLEDTDSGEMEGFGDVDSLLEALRQRTNEVGEEEKNS